MSGHEFDQAYRDKVMRAALEGIVLSVSEDGVAMLRSGEIVDALISIIASIMATSDETKTAQGLRLYCEDFAKTLRRRTLAAQSNPELAKVLSVRRASDIQ